MIVLLLCIYRKLYELHLFQQANRAIDSITNVRKKIALVPNLSSHVIKKT